MQYYFAWDYYHINIYTILLLDILYQLYKEIIITLQGQLTKSIKKKNKPKQMVKKGIYQRIEAQTNK